MMEVEKKPPYPWQAYLSSKCKIGEKRGIGVFTLSGSWPPSSPWSRARAGWQSFKFVFLFLIPPCQSQCRSQQWVGWPCKVFGTYQGRWWNGRRQKERGIMRGDDDDAKKDISRWWWSPETIHVDDDHQREMSSFTSSSSSLIGPEHLTWSTHSLLATTPRLAR